MVAIIIFVPVMLLCMLASLLGETQLVTSIWYILYILKSLSQILEDFDEHLSNEHCTEC